MLQKFCTAYTYVARSVNVIMFLKCTSLAIGAVVAFHTRAFVGVNFVVTRSSILTRTTVTFVDVCNQIVRYHLCARICNEQCNSIPRIHDSVWKKECQPRLIEETLGENIAPNLTRNRQTATCSK